MLSSDLLDTAHHLSRIKIKPNSKLNNMEEVLNCILMKREIKVDHASLEEIQFGEIWNIWVYITWEDVSLKAMRIQSRSSGPPSVLVRRSRPCI